MEWNGDSYFRTTVYFHKTYRKFCQNAVKEYHFTPGEIDVMTFLSNNPGMDTAAQISHCKNISKPLVCRSADTLTKKGFLCPVTDGEDRRIIHLHLTEQSAEAARRLRWCRNEFFRRLVEGIPPEKLSAVGDVMSRMQDNLYHMPGPDEWPENEEKDSSTLYYRKEGTDYES